MGFKWSHQLTISLLERQLTLIENDLETYYEAIGQVLVRIARSRLVAMGLEIDYINFAMKMRLENEKAFIAPQHN